jgi:CRISPR/Cas system-associated endonuclease Cas1
VLANGYDPRAGFLHSGYRDSPALVLDLMEPLRPAVDAAVLMFAQSQSFSGSDFTLRSDGVCRLNPELARRITQIAAAVPANSCTEVTR